MINPPVQGVYADPSQLGTEVEQSNQQVLGMPPYDPKAAAAKAKMNASYTPYYRALLAANNSTPKLDFGPVASWQEGLGKGLGNVMSLQEHHHQQAEDKKYEQAWLSSMNQQQQQAQTGADQAAVQFEKTAGYIGGKYGTEAEAAYRLAPTKFLDAYGTHMGENYTLPVHGTQEGVGAINKGNVQTQGLQNATGITPGQANTGLLPPSYQNAAHAYGLGPQEDQSNLTKTAGDLESQALDNKKKQNDLQVQPQQLQQGLVKDSLAIRHAQLENALQEYTNAIKPIQDRQELTNKSLSNQEVTQRINKANDAHKFVNDLLYEMRTNPNRQLDKRALLLIETQGKALGLDPDLVKNIKELSGAGGKRPFDQKAIDSVVTPNGVQPSNGYVQLSSGAMFHPETGHFIAPGANVNTPTPKPSPKVAPKVLPVAISQPHHAAVVIPPQNVPSPQLTPAESNELANFQYGNPNTFSPQARARYDQLRSKADNGILGNVFEFLQGPGHREAR